MKKALLTDPDTVAEFHRSLVVTFEYGVVTYIDIGSDRYILRMKHQYSVFKNSFRA
jgi:hypothetical protein